jgi:hypothetical protein
MRTAPKRCFHDGTLVLDCPDLSLSFREYACLAGGFLRMEASLKQQQDAASKRPYFGRWVPSDRGFVERGVAMLSRLFVCSALSLTCLLLCSGCSRAPASTPATAQRVRTFRSVTVQNSLVFRQAAALYRAGDRRGALAHIEMLLTTPSLSAADREYLLRQKRICQGVSGSPTPNAGGAFVRGRTASQADCGPRALLMLCRKMGVRADLNSLRGEAGTTVEGASLEGMKRAAESVGFKAEGVQMDRDALANLSGPAIAWVDGEHYLAVLSSGEEGVHVHDPNKTEEEVMSTDELLRRSGGILLTLRR